MENLGFFANCPILITKIPNHAHLKSEVLDMIARCSNVLSLKNNNDSISKTDWVPEENNQSEYLDLVKPIIVDAVSANFKKFNSNGIMFGNFWFQQYQENDTHDWHIHKFCHWANVYFVELPDQRVKTQIQNFDRSGLIDYDAEEGDIVSFPSFLYHRSPKIAKGRKTVISFNTNYI